MDEPLWRAPKRIVRIDFPPGDECHGLVVRVRALKFGQLTELTRLGSSLSRLQGADDMADAVKVYDLLLSHVDSWNLADDDGAPVPVTAEGLGQLDLPVILRIIAAWMEGMAAVPTPLAQTSNGGNGFKEASIPMARS